MLGVAATLLCLKCIKYRKKNNDAHSEAEDPKMRKRQNITQNNLNQTRNENFIL